MLEVQLSGCVRLLKICGEGNDCKMPKSGGNVLRTSVEALRQLVQADGWLLTADDYRIGFGLPGVIALAEGDGKSFLKMCRGLD